MSEWQPIDTLSIDPDKPVLVYSEGKIWLAESYGDKDLWPVHNGCGCCTYSLQSPTHWMPLPSPPQEPRK